MKPLFNTEQIRAWDAFTQEHEPITGIELMNRAAEAALQWIMPRFNKEQPILILTGPGNNGGDGLAIARLLLQQGYAVTTYISAAHSADATKQLHLLQSLFPTKIHPLSEFSSTNKAQLLVDALLGTGFNKSVQGELKTCIESINQHRATTLSIDIPSGLSADAVSVPDCCVKANITLSFQTWKRAFLLPETAPLAGKVEIIPIGLSPAFTHINCCKNFILECNDIISLYQPRIRTAHKGDYGHGLLLAGTTGTLGAALLAARAALRGGIGLLTVRLPENEASLFPLGLPEAMTETYNNESIKSNKPHSAWATGCGLGTNQQAQKQLRVLLQDHNSPGIIDADALNIIASDKTWWALLPKGSLLTPHPKEFDRLFGESTNHYERIEKARFQAQEKEIYILLKGAFSVLAEPNGNIYYNPGGTPALAKAGSGDVLTGLLLALYAQYQNMKTTALMGMYIHARAAEVATQKIATESLLAHETADSFSDVFKELADAKLQNG